jgi:hypothetical protein
MNNSHLVLNYRRNEAFINPALFVLYNDAVNADTFLANSQTLSAISPGPGQPQYTGLAPGTVKCQNIGAIRKFEQGTVFWEVNYEFRIRPEGWYMKVEDVGYTSWPQGQSMWQVPMDQNKLVSPVPRQLDGKGNFLDVRPGSGNSPVFRMFFPHRELPFAPLGIT